MRIASILTLMLSFALLSACGGIETRPEDTANFAGKEYKYYKWRNPPLENTAGSSDSVYLMDPIVRKAVDAQMRQKGYVMDTARAQFDIDYSYAPGLLEGEVSREASNLSPYPTAVPNRQMDQASVDNAYALGGMKETDNIAIVFTDPASNEELWRVLVTKIVEDANRVESAKMESNVQRAINQGMKALPSAP